jgi:hypothetical protein
VVIAMPALVRRPRRCLFSHTDLRRQELLEALANRLLAPAGSSQDLSYPFYPERCLEERARREVSEVELGAYLPSQDSEGLRWLLRVVGRIHLDRRHRLAFRLTARGHTRAETAALLGVSPERVSTMNWETRRRLRECGAQWQSLTTPAQALREVYREDVNRRAYAPEKHCPPGQEDCRETGLCSRRWYLFTLAGEEVAPEEV